MTRLISISLSRSPYFTTVSHSSIHLPFLLLLFLSLLWLFHAAHIGCFCMIYVLILALCQGRMTVCSQTLLLEESFHGTPWWCFKDQLHFQGLGDPTKGGKLGQNLYSNTILITRIYIHFCLPVFSCNYMKMWPH